MVHVRKHKRKLSPKASKFIQKEIVKNLRTCGATRGQAIATAYSTAKAKGYKIPRRK